MSKNDDKILLLKKKIEEKKTELGKVKRFAPITSCSLEMDGTRYNLHVAGREQLILLACKLQALYTAADDLGYADECTISGFHVSEWGSDVKARLDILDQKKTEAELTIMESKLDKLLSEDKKTELELAEIEALLG